MEELQTNEVYEEIIDACFLNIWFVESWDEMSLFVINREIVQKNNKIIGYTGSYVTEYCGQDKSCGNSIEKVEFVDNGVKFTFNKTGRKALEMDCIKITYPENFTGKDAIERRIQEMLHL